ncbi:MAG: PLP-dependent transferase, partial [Proteobacteria bacterium]|nr:PLP-dependent transferase [Pseudomonadota bacterium]
LGGAIVGSHALMEPIYSFVRTAGPSMSPFNAWLFIKGLETLAIRMKAQSEQALAIASWLKAHPAVESVFYTGLSDHPQANLIARQQKAGGAVLSFRVKGGRKEAWRVVDAVTIFSRSANLGDVKSIITHPATTTHGRVAEADRLAAGITENLIRLSIGLESVDDLRADLARGLDALLSA